MRTQRKEPAEEGVAGGRGPGEVAGPRFGRLSRRPGGWDGGTPRCPRWNGLSEMTHLKDRGPCSAQGAEVTGTALPWVGGVGRDHRVFCFLLGVMSANSLAPVPWPQVPGEDPGRGRVREGLSHPRLPLAVPLGSPKVATLGSRRDRVVARAQLWTLGG